MLDLHARHPFFAMELGLSTNRPPPGTVLTVHRKLSHGHWSAPLVTTCLKTDVGDEPTRVFLEPQTAGHYQVRLRSLNLSAAASYPTIEWGRPIYLERIHAKSEVAPDAAPKTGVLVHAPGKTTLEILGDWAEISCDTRARRFLSNGSGGAVTISLSRPFNPSGADVMCARIRNATGSPFLRFSWGAGEGEFDAERSVLVPLVQNDTSLREYRYPLGLEAGWQGAVRQLRLELASLASGVGEIELGAVRLISHPDENSPETPAP